MYNNFYNPYLYNTARTGLFSGLFKKFSFTGFLNGASKTLNVVNQAIPIYNQVKPMINNAKTMFKVISAVKAPDIKNDIKTVTNTKPTTSYINDGNPTFFI